MFQELATDGLSHPLFAHVKLVNGKSCEIKACDLEQCLLYCWEFSWKGPRQIALRLVIWHRTESLNIYIAADLITLYVILVSIIIIFFGGGGNHCSRVRTNGK